VRRTNAQIAADKADARARSNAALTGGPPCWICTNLEPFHLIELDRILSDPLCWPKTIWDAVELPTGGLTYKYRRYGALSMGREWLLANGYEYPDNNKGKMRLFRHFKKHVTMQNVNVDDLIRTGLIAPMKDGRAMSVAAAPLDPLAYVQFYNDGVQAGLKALGLISQKVEGFVERGEEVPLPLLKMLLDAGLKLAASQATIKSAGRPFGDTGQDENESFRGGSDISPQFSHVRVREIEGTSRPVADEGLSDRTRYNERARQEGGTPIGGR
jgi:hypothetical protein